MPILPRIGNPRPGNSPAKSGQHPDGIRPVQPIPEHATEPSEQMLPYRGFDVHGVHGDTSPEPVPSLDGQTVVHYREPKPEPDPIPVRIVHEGGREIATFSGSADYATNVARAIVGENIDRSSVTITNNSAVTVWLNNNMVSKGNGYPLAAGKDVNWTVQTAIYAVSDDGSQAQLAIVQFFSLPLDAAHSVRPGS
ncbi:MAG TPA: hypothetical protein VFI97_03635 [Arthrobacter sp.]|nr:hypothetical protein [Arthrobacter sp.]